jgi:hypothetical protein
MPEIVTPHVKTGPQELNEVLCRTHREEEQRVVERIVVSRHLSKSKLLSNLFLYICHKALDDPEARITEQELGMKVFHRGPQFDPREDNIVRNYTRQLRIRLHSFYSLEGTDETLVIEIPRGGYVPTFSYRPGDAKAGVDIVAVSLSVESLPLEPSPASLRLRGTTTRRIAIFLTCGALSFLAMGWAIGIRSSRMVKAGNEPVASNPIWSQIFSRDQNTVVVPADTGFVIVQQANHRTFSLSEYLRWASGKQPNNKQIAMSYLLGEPYTSMDSLVIASMLEMLPEVTQSRFMIRPPRALRFEDLKEDNVILLGSSYSNPWCEIFEPRLRFHVVNHPESNRYWIADEHPPKNGAPTYESRRDQRSHVTYASVAYLPNLSGKGHVLIIQGLDGAGTWGAAEFLFHGYSQGRLTRDVSLNNGALSHFEMLLEITSLDASSGTTSSRVLIERGI